MSLPMFVGFLAALDQSTLLWWIDVILKVSIGLGAVIFVHELGHYLVARACGVKCEKFMVGFDFGGLKLSRRWGETEYGIGVFPLGGYVKMLGQDDDPAHIAEQMQRSQVSADNTNAVPITGPNGETYYVDRRSYLAKSVPQRMAIISAGVVMNVIFAFIFAVIAYGLGVPYMPSIVSETVPGSPAWRAGIEPGDEIIQLGKVVNPTFLQLKSGVVLGDTEAGIPCLVRRAVDDEVVELRLTPEQQPGQLALIGIVPAFSTSLYERQPTVDFSPAAQARLVSPPPQAGGADAAKLHSGDRIVRVADTPVSAYREIAAILARQPEQPVRITVERTIPAESAGDAREDAEAEKAELTFEVAPHSLRDFGLVMKMGPITAVQSGSPAHAAGLKEEDVIVAVDGVEAGQPGGWTPDTLPDLMRQAAEEGREVKLLVKRSAVHAADGEPVEVSVEPRVPIMYYSGLPLGAPQGVEALGIAYRVTNEVLAVVADGPAADSGIRPGDSITAATIVFPEDENGAAEKPLTIKLGPVEPNWVALVDMVQFAPPETRVDFQLKRPGQEKNVSASVTPSATSGVFDGARGLVFEPIERIRVAATFAEQLRLGWDETFDSLTMVVRFLQKLGRQVPVTMLGGPGTIAAAAGGAASEGFSSLLIFLTMLSANLAVLNILPIPLLDGGHLVFLAYEGLRGRPANERVVVALHTAGFVFIVSLMVFVIGLDVQRWILG